MPFKVLHFVITFTDIHLFIVLKSKTTFVLCHNPAAALRPNAPVSNQSKVDQFFYFHPHPNIPPFRVVCHNDKSSQGGFRQIAVTQVPTGAESEHSRQSDASMLKIYVGGFIVAYIIGGNAGSVLMSVLHL